MENYIINFETVKAIFIIIYTYIVNLKITDTKIKGTMKSIKDISIVTVIAILCAIMKYRVNYLISIISSIFLMSIIFSRENLKYGIITTIISMSLNYIISFFAVIFNFIVIKIIGFSNDYINLAIILVIHIILVQIFFKIKKFKYGLSFLKNSKKNEYIDLFILNIGVIILFTVIIFVNVNLSNTGNFAVGIVIFSIIMFITIQKSIQLYYKQKLLEQELKTTKEKLAKTEKDLKDTEKENIEISKKNHTITHKQKSLNHKIEEIMAKMETSTEISIDIKEVKDRVDKLSKEINEGKVEIELSKTGIEEIDDMLKYMQSECIKKKIDFELQIKGNIHYMVNNLINKEDLETLIADHVRNAIIAIEHTDNINKSILVKLGKIDEIYSLYIYDSGVEFEKETLENLGKKPSTTHAEEGGTGMGFMNTFDTLRKCKASLTINQIGKPSKDDYTKVLIIKFDNKNEFHKN